MNDEKVFVYRIDLFRFHDLRAFSQSPVERPNSAAAADMQPIDCRAALHRDWNEPVYRIYVQLLQSRVGLGR